MFIGLKPTEDAPLNTTELRPPCPHSLGAPLLLHLGLGALRLVPHAGALQLAHQRQHLARGLIPPRPVDERAVGLEDEVGVLRDGTVPRSLTL